MFTKSQHIELKSIFPVIEKNEKKLRQGKVRKNSFIDNFQFCLLKCDRNILYRINGNYNWYLKMPRNIGSNAITRERVGVEIQDSLAAYPMLWPNRNFKVSEENSYILCLEIPGYLLKNMFYLTCWSPFKRHKKSLFRIFNYAGQLLSLMHKKEGGGSVPVANRDIQVSLLKNIEKVPRNNIEYSPLKKWVERHTGPIKYDSFIHGNLSFDNIFVIKNQLHFIDFENCGTGSCYEDLSYIGSHLLLTWCLPTFPWKTGFRAFASFMNGYKSIRPYDRDEMIRYIAMKILNYYIININKISTIGFLPVSQYRLATLKDAILHNEINSLIPDLESII